MEKIQLAAGVMIEKDGKILLVKVRNGVAGGLWSDVGGCLEEGETFVDAARREAKEETGLDVEIGDILTITHENFGPKCLTVMFRGKPTGGKLSIQKDEIAEARWFYLGEIFNMEKEKMYVIPYHAAIAIRDGKQIIYSADKRTP